MLNRCWQRPVRSYEIWTSATGSLTTSFSDLSVDAADYGRQRCCSADGLGAAPTTVESMTSRASERERQVGAVCAMADLVA